MFQLNHMMRRDYTWRNASAVFVAVSITVVTLILPVSAQEVKQKAFGLPEEAMKNPGRDGQGW